MVSKALQQKLEVYEKYYFTYDKPVPFKDGLTLYPVTVDHYNEFHDSLPCLTMDKNIKYERQGELGQLVKVANVEGISQNYLAYLISQMNDKVIGPQLVSQVITLLEIVFKIPRGFYCSKCGKEVSFEEFFKGKDAFVKDKIDKDVKTIKQKIYEYNIQAREQCGELISPDEIDNPPEEEYNKIEVPEDLMKIIERNAEASFFKERTACPEDGCDGVLQEIFSVKQDGNNSMLSIRGITINAKEFDELKVIIPHQNILDYQGDQEINEELKEELEIKAKLQNKGYVTPSVEKQMVCISVATGMTFEYLQSVTLRKLEFLLRIVNKKIEYEAQLQGQMSGMVEFKEPIKHWIYTDDKYDIEKELTDYSSFEQKFQGVL